jgi:hypothetical protein
MIIEIIKYSRIDKPDQLWYKVMANNTYMSVFATQEEAEKYAEMLFNNNGSEVINEETIKTYNNAS